MKKSLKTIKELILTSFSQSTNKLKTLYWKIEKTEIQIKINLRPSFKLKVLPPHPRKYCKNLWCTKQLMFMQEEYCYSHEKETPKAKERTRIIWSNRAASERDKYSIYLLQPFLPDGTVNPKYMKVYGDPRKDPKMRNHPRNMYHKNWKENMEVNKMLERFEARKLR